MPIRLYPHPGAAGRVGIGVEGELFDAEDAARLIGQGIATRRRPDNGRSGPKPARASRSRGTPHRPALRPVATAPAAREAD